MKVACLGPNGSFTSAVAQKVFPDAQLHFVDTYQGCQALKSQEIDYAVYPIENNKGGFVFNTFRAIYQTSKISIVDVETLKIQQNLISHCSDIRDIEAIYSHPQAIRQCQKKIQQLEVEKGSKIKLVELSSTSEGIIAVSKNPKFAAIGSVSAANLYGVPVVKENFQDKSRNETRFAVMKMGNPQSSYKKSKTMFLMEFNNTPNALVQTLNIISSYDINITALNTLPIYSECTPNKYTFFLEVEGHIHDERLTVLRKSILGQKLSGLSRKARWLGSYPEKESILV